MTARPSMKTVWIGLLVPALLLGLPAVASAHGDIRESSPEAGSKVARPPRRVTLTLAEPPSQGSTLVVTDGCERKVSGPPAIQDDVFEAAIEGGEPGRWIVDVRSISAVDGHVVKEAFTFNVSGKKDCSREKEKQTPDPDDDSPDISSRPPIDNPDGPTSFPVVPFALGTVAVVAVAVAVRRPWNKS